MKSTRSRRSRSLLIEAVRSASPRRTASSIFGLAAAGSFSGRGAGRVACAFIDPIEPSAKALQTKRIRDVDRFMAQLSRGRNGVILHPHRHDAEADVIGPAVRLEAHAEC